MSEKPIEEGGPNAHVELEMVWVFKLGKRDSLLVLKALADRLDSDEDYEAAQELGKRLTLLREAAVQGPYKALGRAADMFREKKEESK